MSNEEVLYVAPEDNVDTESAVENENSEFFMSLRSDERENNLNSNEETSPENVPSSDESPIILCALWHSGYLGAAYYSLQESELYVLNDIIDLSPDYILTRNLYNQIRPCYTITLGTMASEFVCALSVIAQRADLEDDDISSAGQSLLSSLPPNIQLLKKDKYTKELCLHAVKTLKLSCEPADLTDEERRLYIHTLVNFNKEVSLQALGALILFLKSSGGHFLTTDQPIYLNINHVVINDLVLMNAEAFESLKIFNPRKLLSGTNGTFEAQSVFRLFNRCRSSIGQQHLKNLLFAPTNNINVLHERHEFIEFCLEPMNVEIVTTIRECLSYIFPITTTLNKMHKNQYKIINWKTLYSTLNNISCVKRICTPYKEQVKLFKNFISEVSEVIDTITKLILDTIDFENSKNRKVAVKIGVNKTLDQKRRYRSEIKERITLASSFEIKNLPSYINECSIVYIPRVGYVVAIKKWIPTAQYQSVEQYGYRHQFTIKDVFHFKSGVCDELDKCLGDMHCEIEDLENSIIGELSQIIMRNNKLLKKPIQIVAQFDSLISMAEVSKQLGFVRPNLVQENIIEIKDGKHPLADMLNVTNFVPNSYYSGGNNQVLRIITGPNNSGKTVYLKQNALIVYLAHVGSYVPAKSATIGMMYSIHTNISVKSSLCSSSGMSTFAIHLTQMSQSINTSKKNSLIVIDEFGRTTTEIDGLSLLTSFLEHYLLREKFCPHILLSTHHLHLTNLIPESNIVEHLKCSIKLTDDNIVFLYKIVKGVSKSFAKYAATKAGIPDDIIQRSEEILKCYLTGTRVKPVDLFK